MNRSCVVMAVCLAFAHGVCHAEVSASGSVGFVEGPSRSLVRGAGLGPFEEAGDIPGCLLGESFDSQPMIEGFDPGSFGSPPYPDVVFGDGGVIPIESPVVGVVDNAVAISSATYNGPAGGPDPLGVRGGMLSVQRASYGGTPIPLGLTSRVYSATHDQYAATPGAPLFVSIDLYKNSHADFQQFQLISFAEGLLAEDCIMGGYYDSGTQAGLAALRGGATLNEGVFLQGIVPGTGQGRLFLGAKDIPEDGWYTLGVLITQGSISVWLRDRDTTDGLDVRTPVRSSGPFAGQRMFAEFGFGLEEDWAQLLPGTADDPGTPGVVEGFGPAVDELGGPAGVLTTAEGNVVSPLLAASSIDTWRLFAGSDPNAAELPGYSIKDWWADNYCVRGGQRVAACPADLSGDSVVSGADLAAMLAAWGTAGASDLNLDGTTDGADLAVLLAAWGGCP